MAEQRGSNDGFFTCDIYRDTKDEYEALAKKGIPKVAADFAAFDMVMKDELYFNKDFTLYSATPIEGFKTWSQLMEEEFNGYLLNEKKQLLPLTAPTINYNTVI